MKKIVWLLLIGITVFSNTISAQGACTHTVLTDDFSSPATWTTHGSGSVTVSGGKCNYNNVRNGHYDRVYQNLSTTLSDTYWKAECTFSLVSGNPPGNSTGGVLVALTAGTLDFISYDASGSYVETTQDGIGVNAFIASATDNNVNNWYFLIEGKKGNVRNFDLATNIPMSSAISLYYLRFERVSAGLTKLSVFSDAAYTTHIPGSPITYTIDPTITGLKTIQHGNSTAGTTTRMLNATIDNDVICDDGVVEPPPPPSTCTHTILTDDFSSPATWTTHGSGSVTVSGGKCKYDNVRNGHYDRVYQNLSTTLSDTYWKAECDFSLESGNPSGNSTGGVLLALTSGTLDFISYDASGSYVETTQDGISVNAFIASATDNNVNNWYFLIEGKKGNIRNFNLATNIPMSSVISNYYLRFERVSAGLMKLSVFSDASRTVPVPGSPITYAIDPTITGLKTIQHGNSTAGSSTRMLNATIDNDVICDDSPAPSSPSTVGIMNIENSGKYVFVYPNPSNSIINIQSQNVGTLDEINNYTIYNLIGSEMMSDKLNSNKQVDISGLSAGIYLLKIVNSKGTYLVKFQRNN